MPIKTIRKAGNGGGGITPWKKLTKTDDYDVVAGDNLKTLVMNAATGKKFTLPSTVGGPDLTYRFVKLGVGALTIEVDDLGTVDEDLLLLIQSGGDANGSPNFSDSSLRLHPVARNGNAIHSTAEFLFEDVEPFSSIELPSGSDYLSIPFTAPNFSDFTFGTNDFTIELFVFFDAVVDSQYLVATGGRGAAGDLFNGGWEVLLESKAHTSGPSTSGDKFLWFTPTGGINTGVGVRIDWTPNANTWYHVRVVRDSGVMKMFIDGVSFTVTGADLSAVNIGTTANLGLQIGHNPNSGGPVSGTDGFYEEIRISKRAITGAAPSAPFSTESLADLIGNDVNFIINSDPEIAAITLQLLAENQWAIISREGF